MAFVPRPRDQLAVFQGGASHTGTNEELRLQLEVWTQKKAGLAGLPNFST
jgi:hypothetical protein